MTQPLTVAQLHELIVDLDSGDVETYINEILGQLSNRDVQNLRDLVFICSMQNETSYEMGYEQGKNDMLEFLEEKLGVTLT